MTQEMLIMVAILVVVIIVSFIGILSRYRKCKSDEVLVVYGKTTGEKSAKLYHGGAAFVWPIIQGYEFLFCNQPVPYNSFRQARFRTYRFHPVSR